MQKRIRGIVTFQRANTTQQTITIIRNSKRGENSGLLSNHGIAQHHNSTRDKLQSGIFTSVHRCKQKMQMSVVLEMYICHRCTVLLTCPLYLCLFFLSHFLLLLVLVLLSASTPTSYHVVIFATCKDASLLY